MKSLTNLSSWEDNPQISSLLGVMLRSPPTMILSKLIHLRENSRFQKTFFPSYGPYRLRRRNDWFNSLLKIFVHRPNKIKNKFVGEQLNEIYIMILVECPIESRSWNTQVGNSSTKPSIRVSHEPIVSCINTIYGQSISINLFREKKLARPPRPLIFTNMIFMRYPSSRLFLL